jgi:hypothetical protein
MHKCDEAIDVDFLLFLICPCVEIYFLTRDHHFSMKRSVFNYWQLPHRSEELPVETEVPLECLG